MRSSNQKLIPRGFSDDPEVDYRWTPSGLQTDKPEVHTFGTFETKEVNVKHGTIEIKGTRYTLAKNDAGNLALSGGSPALLVIDFQGADPAAVLPALKDQLFYSTIDQAQADVPAIYRKALPYDPGKLHYLIQNGGTAHESPRSMAVVRIRRVHRQN